MTTVLVASVGGSARPIVSAIAARRPDRLLFLATEPHGSRPGSRTEIPGILEAAQATRIPHEVLIVPPDDPEAAFLLLRERLHRLAADLPKARLIFDYTGGTKSMTSALFQAALATPAAELQFMAGDRATLDRVTDGTERATRIPVEWLIAERTEARLRAAWASYGYAECAAGLRALLDDLGSDEKAPPETRARLADLAEAAAAFDLWDRFGHAGAAAALRPLAARHAALRPWAERAARLGQLEGARLPDLMRNAERCAARGRFDDAVARCYRLIEWTVQWHLKQSYGIDTGNIDWKNANLTDDVVGKARLSETRRRHLEERPQRPSLGGLMQTLNLADALEPDGQVARFGDLPFPDKDHRTCRARMKYVLAKRNLSILAHGDRPLLQEDWDRFAAFMTHWNAQVLHPLLRAAGIEPETPQLPSSPPAGL